MQNALLLPLARGLKGAFTFSSPPCIPTLTPTPTPRLLEFLASIYHQFLEETAWGTAARKGRRGLRKGSGCAKA